MSNSHDITKPCERCGQNFTQQIQDGWEMLEVDQCLSCAKITEEENAQEAARKQELARAEVRLQAWRDIVPPRYQQTDLEHPDFHLGLWDKVRQWKPTDDKPWLGIVGSFGACKTRIAALRLKQAMENEEMIFKGVYERLPFERITSTGGLMRRSQHPLFVTSYEFSEAFVGQYSNDQSVERESKHLLNSCREAQWLVIDDLDKSVRTEKAADALFALIDHRHKFSMITIWTANTQPEQFCKGAVDVAGALVRRLKELSTLFAV